MKPTFVFKVVLSDAQTHRLQQSLSVLPFKVICEEEREGPGVTVRVRCTLSQKRFIRDILNDVEGTVEQPIKETHESPTFADE